MRERIGDGGSFKRVAVIVAAGFGFRFGGEIPKQFLLLDGEPILRRSVRAFLSHPLIDRVCVVYDPKHTDLLTDALDGLTGFDSVHGGQTRQESSRRGIEAVAALSPEMVLIHDGVRPLVDSRLITRVIEALEESEAVIPGLEIVDRVASSDRLIDRKGLYRIQTPQGFRFSLLRSAHQAGIGLDLPDDAGVVEAYGVAVRIIEGERNNLKITRQDDILHAERSLIHAYQSRTGIGFDIHRLERGEELILCGVKVDSDSGLVGHSDGDVGLHALTDALLGALSAGDIGDHFPPSDLRWKGADSQIFLAHAVRLARDRGGRIDHVDLTLICERPFLTPYKPTMRRKIAEILNIPLDRVSLKATTMERLGAIGREEGIAAQAVATLSLP